MKMEDEEDMASFLKNLNPTDTKLRIRLDA